MTRDNSTPEELLNYISSAIFIKAFIKLYNETKEHYFKNNRQTLFLEIEDYKKENEDINERLRILQIQYEKLKDSYENAKKQIIEEQKDIVGEYEKKIRNLDKRIAELENETSIYKREIIPLRNLIFNKDNELPPKEDMIPDKIYEKGIIFGGHERWVQKMKDRLPNFKFINNSNFDVSVLDNMRYIFFNTEYISHSLYYKVINNISCKDTEISYIDNNNENIVMSKILETIGRK
jgi:archaellum component FlaC